MPKFVPNPGRSVMAHVILDTRHSGPVAEILIEDAAGVQAWIELPGGATARYEPVPGDYLVISTDGYQYVNPKAVFEDHWIPDAPQDATVRVKAPQGMTAAAGQVGESGPKASSPAPESTSPAQNSTPSSDASAPAVSAGSASSAPASDPGTKDIRAASKKAQDKAKSA